ncbi:MAG: PilZ domain-containing protein [Nitrospirae bacterium]|nr:PilZ domain-containing protein [Nitrospirota bacterium]
MVRRSTWRIPIRLNVILSCGSRVSTGTVTNISEKGMFINAEVTGYSEDSKFDISIPLKEGVLHVPGKLVRLSKINGSSNGMGVELTDPPQNYLEFVENLLYVL